LFDLGFPSKIPPRPPFAKGGILFTDKFLISNVIEQKALVKLFEAKKGRTSPYSPGRVPLDVRPYFGNFNKYGTVFIYCSESGSFPPSHFTQTTGDICPYFRIDLLSFHCGLGRISLG